MPGTVKNPTLAFSRHLSSGDLFDKFSPNSTRPGSEAPMCSNKPSHLCQVDCISNSAILSMSHKRVTPSMQNINDEADTFLGKRSKRALCKTGETRSTGSKVQSVLIPRVEPGDPNGSGTDCAFRNSSAHGAQNPGEHCQGHRTCTTDTKKTRNLSLRNRDVMSVESTREPVVVHSTKIGGHQKMQDRGSSLSRGNSSVSKRFDAEDLRMEADEVDSATEVLKDTQTKTNPEADSSSKASQRTEKRAKPVATNSVRYTMRHGHIKTSIERKMLTRLEQKSKNFGLGKSKKCGTRKIENICELNIRNILRPKPSKTKSCLITHEVKSVSDATLPSEGVVSLSSSTVVPALASVHNGNLSSGNLISQAEIDSAQKIAVKSNRFPTNASSAVRNAPNKVREPDGRFATISTSGASQAKSAAGDGKLRRQTEATNTAERDANNRGHGPRGENPLSGIQATHSDTPATRKVNAKATTHLTRVANGARVENRTGRNGISVKLKTDPSKARGDVAVKKNSSKSPGTLNIHQKKITCRAVPPPNTLGDSKNCAVDAKNAENRCIHATRTHGDTIFRSEKTFPCKISDIVQISQKGAAEGEPADNSSVIFHDCIGGEEEVAKSEAMSVRVPDGNSGSTDHRDRQDICPVIQNASGFEEVSELIESNSIVDSAADSSSSLAARAEEEDKIERDENVQDPVGIVQKPLNYNLVSSLTPKAPLLNTNGPSAEDSGNVGSRTLSENKKRVGSRVEREGAHKYARVDNPMSEIRPENENWGTVFPNMSNKTENSEISYSLGERDKLGGAKPWDVEKPVNNPGDRSHANKNVPDFPRGGRIRLSVRLPSTEIPNHPSKVAENASGSRKGGWNAGSERAEDVPKSVSAKLLGRSQSSVPASPGKEGTYQIGASKSRPTNKVRSAVSEGVRDIRSSLKTRHDALRTKHANSLSGGYKSGQKLRLNLGGAEKGMSRHGELRNGRKVVGSSCRNLCGGKKCENIAREGEGSVGEGSQVDESDKAKYDSNGEIWKNIDCLFKNDWDPISRPIKITVSCRSEVLAWYGEEERTRHLNAHKFNNYIQSSNNSRTNPTFSKVDGLAGPHIAGTMENNISALDGTSKANEVREANEPNRRGEFGDIVTNPIHVNEVVENIVACNLRTDECDNGSTLENSDDVSTAESEASTRGTISSDVGRPGEEETHSDSRQCGSDAPLPGRAPSAEEGRTVLKSSQSSNFSGCNLTTNNHIITPILPNIRTIHNQQNIQPPRYTHTQNTASLTQSSTHQPVRGVTVYNLAAVSANLLDREFQRAVADSNPWKVWSILTHY